MRMELVNCKLVSVVAAVAVAYTTGTAPALRVRLQTPCAFKLLSTINLVSYLLS